MTTEIHWIDVAYVANVAVYTSKVWLSNEGFREKL